MALDYLPRIRAIQPSGPYSIGGFCASGLVAYEVARLLRAEGEIVNRLSLINASPLPSRSIPPFDYIMRKVGLNDRLEPKLRTSLCYNLARLHAALAFGPVSTFRLIAGRIALLWSRRPTADQLADPEPFEKRRGELHTENSFAHIVAAFTYHPKPYAGEVTLIWGIDQTITADVPAKAWQAVASNVRVVPMAGGHVDQLSGRIDDLAEAIKSALN
jgi:thioesterase domain-containing protein